MFYWGITYLLGWIFGVWLLLNSGIIGIIDIIIYLSISIVVLILKIIMWLKESS
jgi:NADH:ubiquinone oxidoreductase subunit 6 (subunit J)